MPQLRFERGRSKGAGEATTVLDADLGNESSAPYRRLRPGPGRSASEVTSHQRARIDRALVEIVAESGYGCATVREIARVAGISTRAFYEQYSGKEKCFLRVHRLLARGFLQRVEVSIESVGADDRLGAAVDAVLDEWDRDWRVTWFLLVGPYGAGSDALKQLRLVERSLGAILIRCFSYPVGNGEGSTGHVADGVAFGLVATARMRLLNDKQMQWSLLREKLKRWALSYSPLLPDLDILQSTQVRTAREDAPCPNLARNEADQRPLLGDDLTLLHSAIARLAASWNRGPLTPRRVCAAAGVSRRSFNSHFSSIDDCLVAAAAQRIDMAVRHTQLAGRRSRRASTPETEIYLRLKDLCDQISRDSALASLCFRDLIEGGDWMLQRDRFLIERFAELFELAAKSQGLESTEQLENDAALGAILGLLRNEVAAGRAGCVHRMVPTLAFMTFAPRFDAPSSINATAA